MHVSRFSASDRRPYRLLGCYLDKSDRDLNKVAVTKGIMSISICYNKCKGMKYPYFSVQNGNSCFCGRHFGRYGKRDMSECNKRCNDNSKEFCGGHYRNLVFRIKRAKGGFPDLKIMYEACEFDAFYSELGHFTCIFGLDK
jgi:hypothetical protein